jgi:signal peptidase II
MKAVTDILSRDKITKHWMWGVPLAVTIVAVDQITKAMVLATPRFNALGCLPGLEPCGRIEVSPVFDLTMVWNRGVSFGLAQSEGWARWLLVAMTAVIAIGFLVWLLRASRWMTALALALVVGGAIGNNLIDRVRFGAVVDFLDFSGLYFPWVFNVADAGISVGAAVLLLDQLLAGRKSPG